jgi:hypothetical protein
VYIENEWGRPTAEAAVSGVGFPPWFPIYASRVTVTGHRTEEFLENFLGL